MTPILFVADCPESTLIDSTAIGVDSNPFASRLPEWSKLGLADFIADVDTGKWSGWQELKGSGPDGLSGLALRILPQGSREDAAPIVSRDTCWRRASDRVWFSVCDWQPADLLRYSCQPLPTHTVKLSDGKLWEVPRIRRIVSSGHLLHWTQDMSELPHRVRRTWQGNTIAEPSPRWAGLWDKTTVVAQHLWGEPLSVSYELLLNTSLEVLQLRYRYSELMARAFPEALEMDSIWRVLKAACGWDLAQAYIDEKKNRDLDTAPSP